MERKLNIILANYGFTPLRYKVIRSGQRDVWFISTASSPLILKRLNKDSPFSLYVHEQLHNKNVPLPYLHKTLQGDLFVCYHDQLYALFTFVPGKKPKKTTHNWRILCRSLALFHSRAQHIDIPDKIVTEAKWPTKESWLAEKEKQLNFILEQSDHPLFNKQKKGAKLFRQIGMQAEKSITRCQKAPFTDYVQLKQQAKQLCHGDYGETSNFLISRQRHYIIDLDEVYYGLPINDLAHLLRKSVRKPELTLGILRWYQVKRLPALDLEIFKADLSFPHLFYHALRNHALRGRNKKEMIIPFLREIANIEQKRVDEI